MYIYIYMLLSYIFVQESNGSLDPVQCLIRHLGVMQEQKSEFRGSRHFCLSVSLHVIHTL